MLDKIYALADMLDIEAPKNVRVFDEYMNNSHVRGLYNQNKSQVYMRKDVLESGLEEALNVYLHEANHHVSGSDDVSRGFADSLCIMLTRLLLRYSEEVGVKSHVRITDRELILPSCFPAISSHYANVVAIGNRMSIYTADGTLDVALPLILASPVCGTRKITAKKEGYALKLPAKIASALAYVNMGEPLDCIVKYSDRVEPANL